MRWFNLNAFHNLVNLVIGVLGAMMVFDWTALGISPQQVGTIIGILALVKLVANAVRDGLAGMVKTQPPVADQTKTITVVSPSHTDVSVSTPSGEKVDLKANVPAKP